MQITVMQFDFGLVCLMLEVPVNNFSVMLGQNHRFLGITSAFGGKEFDFGFDGSGPFRSDFSYVSNH